MTKTVAHRLGEPLVHGEAFPLPVAGGAQPLQLADDLPARFGLPLPDPLDERFAPQVVAVLPFGGQLALHHVLGGDAGMVGARHPEDVVALHPLPAAEDVLQGVVEGMPHVQGAGHVGGRDDDTVRFPAGSRSGTEIPLALPFGIPSLFYVMGFIPLGKFSLSHANNLFEVLIWTIKMKRGYKIPVSNHV